MSTTNDMRVCKMWNFLTMYADEQETRRIKRIIRVRNLLGFSAQTRSPEFIFSRLYNEYVYGLMAQRLQNPTADTIFTDNDYELIATSMVDEFAIRNRFKLSNKLHASIAELFCEAIYNHADPWFDVAWSSKDPRTILSRFVQASQSVAQFDRYVESLLGRVHPEYYYDKVLWNAYTKSEYRTSLTVADSWMTNMNLAQAVATEAVVFEVRTQGPVMVRKPCVSAVDERISSQVHNLHIAVQQAIEEEVESVFDAK